MGRFDPLTDEAMHILHALKDPISDEDHMSPLIDRLLDDSRWIGAFVRAVLKGDQDGIEVAKGHVSATATRYAFDAAREYLEGREPAADPHDVYGVSRGPL